MQRLTRLALTAAPLSAVMMLMMMSPGLARAADNLPEFLEEVHGQVENLKDAFSNYQACIARGADPALCESLAIYCAIPGTGLIDSRAGLFSELDLFQVFKLDCGDGECYQCCFTGEGCHTSFIGFPVINCNYNYGPETRDAGITLIVDPDAQPGAPCISTPQTCDHLSLCLGDPNALGELRDELEGGLEHPLNMAGAAEQRLRYFGRDFFDRWLAYLGEFHTGIAPDRAPGEVITLAALEHFMTARGCAGWRDHVDAIQPYEWGVEPFAITGADDVVSAPASQLNGVRLIGLMRLLDALPNLAGRHAAVESTVWPDEDREAYLGQLDVDPDDAILRVASPIFLELLKRSTKISDYRLLAVPLAEEPGGAARFNGCLLGQAPHVIAEAGAPAGASASLRLTIDNPELGGAHERALLAIVLWGDGTASRELLAADQAEVTLSHEYVTPGRYAAHAVVENTSGLRGVASAIIESTAAAPEASAPHVFSQVRLVDAVAYVDVTSGNERKLYLEITGRDADTGEELLLGVGQERAIPFNVDVPLGTLIGHNQDARRVDRITLWPAWRDGFYGLGWGGHYLALEQLELRVPSTATGETVAVPVPLTTDNVRVYPVGGEEPVDVEFLGETMDGRPLIWLHTSFEADRVEIDIPAGLLASGAPGPLQDGEGVVFESLVEVRPGTFEPPGEEPEDTTTGGGASTGDDSGASGDAGSGAATATGGDSDGAAAGDGEGGGCGCASTSPRGGLWALLLALCFVRRRATTRT
ncbi:MAG: hypothetical protein H6713_27870 [Myxococcales bacterium]|nr:hypothetical protein [Myxococcales bacterium]MCB9753778.1 hypothetical protein [Myxococcales bacterium]